ncbi:MAG: hypothetical protein ACI957_003819 [Verrucomicrobiales bacterium]|jgi:hypothetical protein
MTSEHSHPSRHAKILLAAVIWEHFERQTMDGLNDEVDEIVFGGPVTHVRGSSIGVSRPTKRALMLRY